MGYELTRFVGEIDVEFHCSICTMVLENPVQTPCDHLFCSQCINEWLLIDKSCAVDRRPLTNIDLKPISRTVQNLLSKLDIKCDFHPKGCKEFVKMEFLQRHLTSCEYNPESSIVCNKGCNLEMRRCEYLESNCFIHLTMRHEKEVFKLNNELSKQKEYFDRVVNRQEVENKKQFDDLNQLRSYQDQLKGVINQQKEDIKKYSSEINQQKVEIRKHSSEVNHQKEEIRKLSNEVNQYRHQNEDSIQHLKKEFFIKLSEKSKSPLRFQKYENLKICVDQPDIFEIESDDRGWGWLQSFFALEPTNSSFKIQVLKKTYIQMKLSYMGTNNCASDKFCAQYSLSYNELHIDDRKEYKGDERKVEVGDIIELGIKFPLNFYKGNNSVKLHVTINEQVEVESDLKMPGSPIYPLVSICYRETRFKYLG